MMSPAKSVPPSPFENLRFSPGNTVLSHIDGYWKRGKVLECNPVEYDENDTPERMAYKVLCGDHALLAPEDTDFCIRPFSKKVLLTLDGAAPDPLLLEQEFPVGTVTLQA